MKLPEELELSPLGFGARPAKLTVIGVLPANPVPVMVTAVPVGPLTGSRVIFETTLKLLDREFVPSIAVMVCAPAVDRGTAKFTEKEPAESDITVVTLFASYWIVMSEDALKLEPVAFTILPVLPFTGEVLKVGGVAMEPVVMLKYTWKFAAALSCHTANTSVPETAKLELESSVTVPRCDHC